MKHFFSRIQVKTKKLKKRSSPEMEHLFSPNSSTDLRSDAHQSHIIGGNADENHTQIDGGLGEIYPSHFPSRVSAPLLGKTLDGYFPLRPSSLPAVEAQKEEKLAKRTQKMLGVRGVPRIFD